MDQFRISLLLIKEKLEILKEICHGFLVRRKTRIVVVKSRVSVVKSRISVVKSISYSLSICLSYITVMIHIPFLI